MKSLDTFCSFGKKIGEGKETTFKNLFRFLSFVSCDFMALFPSQHRGHESRLCFLIMTRSALINFWKSQYNISKVLYTKYCIDMKVKDSKKDPLWKQEQVEGKEKNGWNTWKCYVFNFYELLQLSLNTKLPFLLFQGMSQAKSWQTKCLEKLSTFCSLSCMWIMSLHVL